MKLKLRQRFLVLSSLALISGGLFLSSCGNQMSNGQTPPTKEPIEKPQDPNNTKPDMGNNEANKEPTPVSQGYPKTVNAPNFSEQRDINVDIANNQYRLVHPFNQNSVNFIKTYIATNPKNITAMYGGNLSNRLIDIDTNLNDTELAAKIKEIKDNPQPNNNNSQLLASPNDDSKTYKDKSKWATELYLQRDDYAAFLSLIKYDGHSLDKQIVNWVDDYKTQQQKDLYRRNNVELYRLDLFYLLFSDPVFDETNKTLSFNLYLVSWKTVQLSDGIQYPNTAANLGHFIFLNAI
ncbi:hypothetical protein [[Mycoplasma] imitans]|uniref:hypothetical protein n=1 Tax=[Mycoplasma] imitans TaxID=29560 RepID=UPI000485F5AC|nr:hypothetical protein [[Mycoplasma] imitans]